MLPLLFSPPPSSSRHDRPVFVFWSEETAGPVWALLFPFAGFLTRCHQLVNAHTHHRPHHTTPPLLRSDLLLLLHLNKRAVAFWTTKQRRLDSCRNHIPPSNMHPRTPTRASAKPKHQSQPRRRRRKVRNSNGPFVGSSFAPPRPREVSFRFRTNMSKVRRFLLCPPRRALVGEILLKLKLQF